MFLQSKRFAFAIAIVLLLQNACFANLRSMANEMAEAMAKEKNIGEEFKQFETDFLMQAEMQRIRNNCDQYATEEQIVNFVICADEYAVSERMKMMIGSYKPLVEKIRVLDRQFRRLSEKEKKLINEYICEHPKMAFFCAKEQSSIIGPSVGTFFKLLEAYVAETNMLGTWEQTGYTPVQSSPFLFDEISTYEDSVLSIQGLRITNTVDLADCPAESSWRIQCYAAENGSVRCNCYVDSENVAACEALTPRFKAYSFCTN